MEKVKSFFKPILQFLNVVDRKGNLSITNVAVIIVVTKIAIAQSVGITEAGALLITLLNYGHKRQEDAKAAKLEKEAVIAQDKKAEDVKMEDLKSTIEKVVEVQNKITQDMVVIKSTHESVAKTAEEAKKLLSQTNLAAAFQPRSQR